MFSEIEILKAASSLARYAAQRQALVAENIANADTPGYRARDLEPFGVAFERAAGVPATFVERPSAYPGPANPNGNNVSLEDELRRGAENARDHATALAIYGKTLAILRASLGGR
ncbi:MAG: flagellar basal body protein [Pseudomonadota bacterium]